jgi:hypothetical protein
VYLDVLAAGDLSLSSRPRRMGERVRPPPPPRLLRISFPPPKPEPMNPAPPPPRPCTVITYIHFMYRSVPSCTLQFPVNFWEMALAYQLDAISQDTKNSRFLGPNPLPLALVMDLHGTVNQYNNGKKPSCGSGMILSGTYFPGRLGLDPDLAGYN